MRKINRLVVHCSDTPTGRDVSAADIRRWHTEDNGWRDIGYSHVIRIDGTIELGRPIEQVGSHVAGHNSDSLGICLVGRDKFSYEQYHNLCILLKSLMAQFNLSPKDVYGHRELANGKSCPGNLDLDKLRKDIA
jgi:hypothetical protein